MRKDGSKFWAEIQSKNRMENGRKIRTTALRDMTDRKRAELEMQRTTNLLRQAEKIAGMGSWEWDIANDITQWSDGLFRIFKRDPADGAPNWAEQPTIFVPEDFERLRTVVGDCIKTGAPYEVELRAIRSDGEIRHCIARGEAERGPDGAIHRLFGILQDITERKKAAQALAENEKQRHQLMDALQEGVWVIDAQGTTTFVNPPMAEMLGYSAQEMKGKRLFDFMDAQGVETAKRNLDRRKQGISEQHEFVFRHRSGAAVHTIIETAPLLDADGDFAGAVAGVLDITARKRAEERLQASLIDLELAQRIAHIGNWALDPAVGVPVWSDEVYRIYERDPALGPIPVEDYKKIYPPDQYVAFHGAIQGAIREGKPYDIQLNLTLPGGNKKWVHAICEPDPTPGPAGHFLRGTIQDITDAKVAEEKLQAYSHRLEEMVEARTKALEDAQAELLVKERLAVLGHFAGSISHEIRNPLAAIDSSVYLLKLKMEGADRSVLDHLDRITTNVRKGTAIIESLLNLSRMEKPRTVETDLIPLVSETLRSAKVPETVDSRIDAPDGPLWVDIDAEQMRMALKNIIKNAIQAMDGSGTLTIATQQLSAGDVELSVTDTGPGIAPEHIDKLFEPLFSTKTHGIGFGLSISKMIVENHGGTIRAASPPEGGARFVMTLTQTRPPRF
jgi:PAS domain S-box-containing protein